MKEIHWKIYNFLWLIAFVLLVSQAMQIPIIGVAFLPLLFVFVWFFSITVGKFGSSWIVWMVPYTFSSIFYLWFFVGGNPLTFVFKDFWLSLSLWLTPPLSPFGMATLLIAISYVVSYFIVHNSKHTMNASLALVVTSAIAGIASQYDHPFVAFGFTILLVGALILNSKYNKKKMSKMVISFIVITILIATLFFSIGTLFKPFTPLGELFTSKALTSSSTTVSSPHHIEVGGVPAKGHTYVPAGSLREVPDWLYEIVLNVFGVIVTVIGVVVLIGSFLVKDKKNKKARLKSIILIVWAAFSTVFLLFFFMYLSKIVSHRSFPPGVNISQQPAQPVIAHKATQALASTATKFFNLHVKNPISLLLNPVVLSALIVMGAIAIVYAVFKFAGSVRPIGQEEKTEVNEHVSVHESENVDRMDYKGNPRETVLFYYRVLRARFGDPSLTPYEFERWLEEKVGKEKSGTLTEVFVKLRYAHLKISEREANSVKKIVKEILANV